MNYFTPHPTKKKIEVIYIYIYIVGRFAFDVWSPMEAWNVEFLSTSRCPAEACLPPLFFSLSLITNA